MSLMQSQLLLLPWVCDLLEKIGVPYLDTLLQYQLYQCSVLRY